MPLADPKNHGSVDSGFILKLEKLENRPLLQKVKESLEYSGNFL